MNLRMDIDITADVYIETCFFLTQIVGENQVPGHEESIKEINAILEGAPPQLRAHLDWMREENHHGHLCEFRLHSGVKSIDAVLDFMEDLSAEQFYYFFYNERLPEEEIRHLPETEKNGLQRDTIELFHLVKEKMKDFCCRLDAAGYYGEAIAEVFQELKTVGPMEFAQIKMGKTFKRVSDYERYHFIPSILMKDTPHRFFTDSEMMLTWGIFHKPVSMTVAELADVLKVVGDPTRLRILKMISIKPMYGKEMADELNIRAATITHHMEQLKRHRLIHVEQHGQNKYYSINRLTYRNLMEEMQNIFK